jgi:hypothetical protein
LRLLPTKIEGGKPKNDYHHYHKCLNNNLIAIISKK